MCSSSLCVNPDSSCDPTCDQQFSAATGGDLQNSIPASSSGSNSSGIWGGITSLAGNLAGIAKSFISPTATLSPTMTAAQQYPVVVNGQVVGYSSTPSTSTLSSSYGSGMGTFLIVGLLLILGLVFLGRRR